ncbi:MAG: hypothetical protein GY953_37785 [bacterium]|nr:hypothetical protein [bacterium]
MFAEITDVTTLIGSDPERLSIPEQTALAGRWVAIEIYTPASLPLKRIEAIGDSVEACVTKLRSRGLDPMRFEFSIMKPPY